MLFRSVPSGVHALRHAGHAVLLQKGAGVGSGIVDADYVTQKRSAHDRRAVKVSLTKKGAALCEKLAEFDAVHDKALSEDAATRKESEAAINTLRRLEQSWTGGAAHVAIAEEGAAQVEEDAFD